MRIIFTVASLDSKFGGPSRSVPALADALVDAGTAVEIITLSEAVQRPPVSKARVTHVRMNTNRYFPLAGSCRFRQALGAALEEPGSLIIHDNGVWLPTNHFSASAARRRRVRFVSSPRGMLTPWAMQHNGWKKKIAWMLFQRRDLHSAHVLHATSHDEAAGFRALGLRQPITIIPNGVVIPPLVSPFSFDDSPQRTRVALFLSRIHRKKGLLDLVKAWARVKPVGWRVVIAGNDDGGHQAEVQRCVSENQLNDVFSIIGPVDDDRKWEIYRAADLFVLPSYSENFGIVIAEALACEVPVITTRETPWEELTTHRCGWWVDIGVEPLAAALREAIALRDSERRELGRRGRLLIQASYAWPAIAARMLSVYRLILGEGEKPAWVELT